MSGINTIKEIDINHLPKGEISKYWLDLVEDGMGLPVQVPLIIARGYEDGPILGLTAAVHGNELNGIPVIQRLFKEIDPSHLKGTIIGVPIVNVPSYLRKKRRFLDGVDLNHIMPGKENGTVSQVYAWRVINKLIKKFDYLLQRLMEPATMLSIPDSVCNIRWPDESMPLQTPARSLPPASTSISLFCRKDRRSNSSTILSVEFSNGTSNVQISVRNVFKNSVRST